MVDNNRRTKLLPKIIFGQVGFALLVALLAFGTIFYAQGYRFDFQSRSISRTGVLVLDYTQNDLNIKINNKDLCKNNPCALNLAPGSYFVSITKSGYQGWGVSLRVMAESVNVYDNIFLVKSGITSTKLDDAQKIALLSVPTDILATNAADRLIYNDHEIWVGSKLVTRLSTNIYKAIWYPDLSHIVFQQDDEIRIIEKNGQNDTLLVKLTKNQPENFAVTSRGDELVFTDSGENKIAAIK